MNWTIQYVDFYADRRAEPFDKKETAMRRLADMAKRPANYRKARLVEGWQPVKQSDKWW